MATEQEELKLTVTLADNASAGLAKLNEEIKQLGSGASQQHVEKFKRETTELTSKIKGMTGEVGEAFKGLGMLRSGLAAGAAGLALFGFEMVKQTKALIDYADKIRALNQQARQIGVNPAQLKDTIEQLQAFGISGEAAVASIGAVSAKIAELQRVGSQLRLDLMRGAGHDPESVRNMADYLDRLTRAKSLNEELNIIRQGGEQVYNNARRQGYSEQEAANRRNNFWQMQGYSAQLANAGKLKELSVEEQRIADQRQKNAEALANEWGQVEKKYDSLVETLKQPFIPYLITALKVAEDVLDSITSKINEIEEKKLLRPDKAKESIQEKFDRFRGAPSFDERFHGEKQDENTKALKDLSDALKRSGYQPSSFSGDGFGGGGIIPAAFHPPSGGPMFGGGGGSWGGGGARFGSAEFPNLGGGQVPQALGGGRVGGGGGGGPPYGSDTGGNTGTPSSGPAGDPSVPSDILEKAKAVALHSGPGGVEQFMANQGYPKAGNWCGEFAASVVKSAGGTPPKNPAIASNWRNWGTAVEGAPQPGDVAVRRGTRTGATGSHVTFVESFDPKTGRFTGLGGNQGRWESQQIASQYEFRRGGLPNGAQAGGGSVATGDAIPATGGGAEYLRQQRAPLTGQLQADPQLKKELAALGTLEHESDATAVVESLYNRTTATNEARAKQGKPALSLSQMIKGGFYGPVNKGLLQSRVAELERDPARMKKMMGAIDAASTSNLLKGATDQGSGNDPNVYWPGGKIERYGETYNDWGGGAGHAGNAAFRQRQQAAIAAADRNQLDQSTVAATKVEGTGKLSVHVSAPKGTNVAAEGGGLFKKVEMNRQTQMNPAERGPKGSGYATEQFL